MLRNSKTINLIFKMYTLLKTKVVWKIISNLKDILRQKIETNIFNTL